VAYRFCHQPHAQRCADAATEGHQNTRQTRVPDLSAGGVGVAHAINQVWSMDFVVNGFTRECLAIEVRQSLKGDDVVNILMRITDQ
jgi:hypothetical protein